MRQQWYSSIVLAVLFVSFRLIFFNPKEGNLQREREKGKGGANLAPLLEMDLETKVIDGFEKTNPFWKAWSLSLAIHASEVIQGQGQGHKRPKRKGLKFVDL